MSEEETKQTVQLSDDDMSTVRTAQSELNSQLFGLGNASRSLIKLKAEIQVVIDKQQAAIDEKVAAVDNSERELQNLLKLLAKKHNINLDDKCNFDLDTGVFTIG